MNRTPGVHNHQPPEIASYSLAEITNSHETQIARYYPFLRNVWFHSHLLVSLRLSSRNICLPMHQAIYVYLYMRDGLFVYV